MKTLCLELIRTDGGTQMRAEIDRDTLLEYRDVWKASPDSFPPLVVFHDGGKDAPYWLADGFHRFYGAREAGRASVPVDVRSGTQRDAILYAVGANQANGMRRSNADKRNAVTTLLNDSEWVSWSDNKLADQAGVSVQTVCSIRKELSNLDSSPAAAQADKPRTGKDGKKRKPPKPKRKVRSQSDEPRNGAPDKPDYGKCPSCAGTKWKSDESGVSCAKCNHPHGEPVGDVDGDRVSVQRSKTVKTVEALMRAFDDLNLLLPKPAHGPAIASCKSLLSTAKGWK